VTSGDAAPHSTECTPRANGPKTLRLLKLTAWAEPWQNACAAISVPHWRQTTCEARRMGACKSLFRKGK
jgi:hypothetical protein